MANKKILTVEEQKHLLSTLPELFQSLTQTEVQAIVAKLGLQDLLDEDGNIFNIYTVDVSSNKPTHIISDYSINIRGNAYNKGLAANDDVDSWRWERDSGVPAEDTAWAQDKTTQEITLSEEDFTSRLNTRDITFRVYATIKNTEYSDEVTFSKSQVFNKIQIKTSHDLFLENSPSSIEVTTVEEGIFSDYKWYLGESFLSSSRNFNLSVNSIPLKGSAVLKVEAKDPTGKIHSDTKTIPRISNGIDGIPGVPGEPGIPGEPGVPGEAGTTFYTWIKYSDSPEGLNMSEYPIDELTGEARKYLGIAANKTSPIESNDPADYTWAKYGGDQGIPGESVFSSIIFKRSANAPTTPTGGSYFDPVPAGWSDGIPDPEEDYPVWMSTRIFTLSENSPQEPVWSEPQITSDTATLDFEWSSSDVINPGTPDAPLYGAVWGNTSSTESIWMAIQRTINGEKKPWEVKKIKGERGIDGEDGQNIVTSFVFKRFSTKPTTPSGGTFLNPIPSGWSDGIPAELDGMPLWMSSRIITSDGMPPQTDWTEPVLAADTVNLDFEWTESTSNNPGTPDAPLNGAVWTNQSSINSVWMAVRKIENGMPKQWNVTKIKGEKGNNSFNANVFKRSEVQPETPIGGSYSSHIPSGWSDGIPEADGNPAWISTRIFSSDGLAPQQGTWSTPSLVADTSSIDYEFSTFAGENPGNPSAPLNGAVWTNESSADTVWMAVSEISNGVRGEWSVSKIKGEKGASSYMWIKFSEYQAGRDSAGNVSMYDTPFIMEGGVRENMVYMGIAYNKSTQQEAPHNTPEGAPEVYTWAKIRGDDGHSNYVLDMSNENVSVPAMADGSIPNPGIAFSTAKTNLKLYYGNDLVDPMDYNIFFDASPGLTYTLSNNDHTLQITGMTSDVGQVKIEIFSLDTVPYLITTGTFTITKLKGIAIYEIFPSVSAIKVKNGVTGQASSPEPTAIEVGVKMNTGDAVLNVTTGRLTYKYIYANTNSSSTDDGTQITIGELMQINNSGNPLFLEFKYFHPVTNTLVDTERIPFVRDGVSGTSVEQRYRANTNPSTAPAVNTSETNPTGWSIDMPVLATGEVLWMIKATKRGDTGDLIGTWSTPVRVSGGTGPQGPQGPPGINGTTGPTPRLLEFVQGQAYKNGGLYIDYAYYRSSDVNEGWYTVKLPSGHTPGTEVSQVYAGGIPDSTKFTKAPFTKEMSFGNVIAEQANLAGFFFRNQLLTSQAKSDQICGGVATRYPNLTLDGIQGIIKFLDRMTLDKSGIQLKDDCGNPRMLFQWDQGSGVPILKFLNTDGSTKWEAGESGYKIIVTGTQPATRSTQKALIRVQALKSYNETSAITIDDPEIQMTVLNNVLSDAVGTQARNSSRRLIYQTQQLDISGGSPDLTDPYYMIYSQTAFPTVENLTNEEYIVTEWKKGDMAGDMDKYDAWYRGTGGPIVESSIGAAPAGTFAPDGWYFMQGASGQNRNTSSIYQATVGVYPFMEWPDVDPYEVFGFHPVELVYMKNGNIVRSVRYVEKATWQVSPPQ